MKLSFKHLATLTIATCYSLIANASDKIGDLYYDLYSSSLTAYVTYYQLGDNNYPNLQGEIEIPSTVVYSGKEYTVTKISKQAFENCVGITKVSIPSTVIAIENYAFDGCSNLYEVAIEDGDSELKFSDTKIFSGCPIVSVYLGRNLTYSSSNSPFFAKSKLRKINFGENVTTLGSHLFSNCTSLTSVSFPPSISKIGSACFSYCSSLSSLSIPSTISKICGSAFSNCDKISSITIDDSTEPLELEYQCFRCSNLTDLYLGRDVFYSYGNNETPFYRSLKRVTIGENVTSIYDNLFYGLSELEPFEILPSLSSIGQFAFAGCDKITDLKIPATVTSIGRYAFQNCKGLKNVTIEDSNEELAIGSGNVFDGCSLESLYLGRTLSYSTSMAEYSPFFYQRTLNYVKISDSVVSLPSNLFCGCSDLSSITIPASVNSIGINTFESCDGLKNLVIDDGVSTLKLECYSNGKSAFSSLRLDSLYIGRNLSPSISTADYPLFNCSGALHTLSIGSRVTELPSYTFYSYYRIPYINLYTSNIESFESIGLSPNSLVTVYLNESPSNLKLSALTYFKSLTFKSDDKSYGLVTSAEPLLSDDCLYSLGDYYILPFDGCSVRAKNSNLFYLFRGKNVTEVLTSESGFHFSPESYYSKNLFRIYGQETSYSKSVELSEAGTLFEIIGLQNIEKINWLTISGPINGTDVMTINRMTGLKFLDISKATIVEGGVTYRQHLKTENNIVGSYFFHDINLEILLLPETATTIDKNAFYESQSLLYISIPNFIKAIETEAFYGCSGLQEITIPESMASIGSHAFENCDRLSTLTIEGQNNSVLSLPNNCFTSCPLKSVSLFRNLWFASSADENYSPFYNHSSITDVTIGNAVTEINSCLFKGCGGLTEITLPSSVTHIGRSAFEGCGSLHTIDIPSTVIFIEQSAFKNCRVLSHINLPTQITYIGKELFYGCSILSKISVPESVTSIGESAFYGCSSLSSIEIPKSVTRIEANTFNSCSSLTSVEIPKFVTSIGANAFANCASLASIQLPKNLTSISLRLFKNCTSLRQINIPDNCTSIATEAFYNTPLSEIIIPACVTNIDADAFKLCNKLLKVYSLNPTPPIIVASSFDSSTYENATLLVTKGSLAYYWLDPQWKAFTNMTDDMISLAAIPDIEYGSDEIDLDDYAPSGVVLRYETSNDDVAKITGNKLQIVGAGSASVAAYFVEEGLSTELLGQIRQFDIEKSELSVTVDDIVIEQGAEIPELTYRIEGFKYDDTINDIEELPQPIHNVSAESPIGKYEISFTQGNDKNYSFLTKNASITITPNSTLKEPIENLKDFIEIYDLNGIFVYSGPLTEASLNKGLYIIRQGNLTAKILIK